MAEKGDVHNEDNVLVGSDYVDAVKRAAKRTLTDEQFNYMSGLDEHQLKAYLGKKGEGYQERLVTVLKVSFDRALVKNQTEAAQELFHKTGALINQTHFSKSSLSAWGDSLYYMENRIYEIPDGKKSKEIATTLFNASNTKYSERYGDYKEEKFAEEDAERKRRNVAKLAKNGQLIPNPELHMGSGISAADAETIIRLGEGLKLAGLAQLPQGSVKSSGRSTKNKARGATQAK